MKERYFVLIICLCVFAGHLKVTALDCGSAPTAATNGGVTGTTFLQGDTVTYTCDATYAVTLGGTTTATCLASGSWDNPIAPVCLKDCASAPTAATNGGVTGTTFLQGDTVTYTCDATYAVTSGGTTTATCLASGSWDNPTAPVCLKDCGSAPTAATNGGVTGTTFLQGDTVTYTCDATYAVTLGGTTTATCLASGSWDNPTAPVCLKDCASAPTAATNGGVTGTTFLQGDTVTYTCDATYAVTSGGTTTATCLASGSWDNPTAPVCLKDCASAPTAATNGGVTGTTFLQGDTVTYTCDATYAVTSGGTTTATCLASGSWDNPTAPVCLKDCASAPTAATNGGVTGTTFLQGDTVTYTCDATYAVTSGGTTTATCLASGSWDNPTAPVCLKDCASAPTAATNGGVTGTTFLQGDTVTYTCDATYAVTSGGTTTATCLASGSWDNPTAPVCLKDCASAPTAATNGGVTGTTFLQGDTVTYTCDATYAVTSGGTTTATCLASGSWDNPTAPVCLKDCASAPTAATNGGVTGTTFLQGDTVTYTCDATYAVTSGGTTTATCLASGSWDNPTAPVCLKDCASAPTAATNGGVTGTTFLQGDTVTYTCDATYAVTSGGTTTATCLASGSWDNPTAPVCLKDCASAPTAATNGGVTGTTFLQGDTVTYTCDATYAVTSGGTTTATCLASGSWDNPTAPVCLKDCASAPTAATNGGVTGTTFLQGDTVTYTCDATYAVTSGGTTTATCLASGSWDNPTAPVCLKGKHSVYIGFVMTTSVS